MTIEIRKMGFGELFDKGIRIFFEHFKTLILVLLILVAPFHFVLIIIPNRMNRGTDAADPDPATVLYLALFSFLSLLAYFTLVSFTNGIIARAIMDEVVEGKMRMGLVVRKVLHVFVPLLLTLLIMALVIGGSVAIITMIGFLFLLMGPPGLIFTIPIVLAGTLLGIYMSLVYALTPYAVVLEGYKHVKAMERSRRLMKGFIGKYFLISLILGIASLMFNLLFGELPSFMGLTENWQVLGWAISATLSTAFTAYTAIVVTLFYIDLKVRKEGFDLALLSGRAQKDAPPP